MAAVTTYAVPTDWQEARQTVEAALDEWGPSRFQEMVVWSIAENENVAAALQYIETLKELEASAEDARG